MEKIEKIEKIKRRLQGLELGLAASDGITHDEWVGSRCYYHCQRQELQALCPEHKEQRLSILFCLDNYEKFLKAIKKEKEKIASNLFMELEKWKTEPIKDTLIWEEPKEYVEEKAWEKEPATAKQKDLLVKKGFLEPEVSMWTKGKASFELSKIM